MQFLLISHALCPYVQRVAIALHEHGLAFTRRNIDLARKPDWFLAMSPLGKTPVLVADGVPIFESAVILEYLEEVGPNPLHPESPLERAHHRGWIEVASVLLNDIAAFYGSPDEAAFSMRRQRLFARLAEVEAGLGDGPYFAGEQFSLVDAAFAPVFRYFDRFEALGLISGVGRFHRLTGWRDALQRRPSVVAAAAPDYAERLDLFLKARSGWLGTLLRSSAS